jgi:hypothetical protein
MGSLLADALAGSGALDPMVCAELSKMGLPVKVPAEKHIAEDPDAAVIALEHALNSEDQVEVRITNLDILRDYLRSRRKGKLHVVTPEGEEGTFAISFGQTKRGEYIIPWQSEGIGELMTNGQTHLIDGRRKVYFHATQECYFGEARAFMVCSPSPREEKSRGRSK